MPHVHREADFAGNDVRGAGLDCERPDRRDEPFLVSSDPLDREDDLARGRKCVAAALHGRRPGVTRAAAERHRGPRLARDRGDDADRKVLPLEHAALLDVRLEVAGERRSARAGELLGIGTRRTHRLAHRDPVGVL